MAHPLTLPAVAALTLVGAGLGIHLGNSAISQINPVFYDGEDSYFSFASLSPNRGRDRSQPQDFWESELSVSRDSYCPGCDDPREMPIGGGYQAAAYVAAEEAATPEPLYVEGAPDPARAEIVRYAAFQVEAEPQQEPLETAEAEAPPAVAETAISAF